MTDPTKHHYFQKPLRLYAQGKFRPGTVTDVDVLHDDWCGIYPGAYCDCDPDIRLRRWTGTDGANSM